MYKNLNSYKFNIEPVSDNCDTIMYIKVSLQFTVPKHYVTKAYGVFGGEAPHIPNLDTRRKWWGWSMGVSQRIL